MYEVRSSCRSISSFYRDFCNPLIPVSAFWSKFMLNFNIFFAYIRYLSYNAISCLMLCWKTIYSQSWLELWIFLIFIYYVHRVNFFSDYSYSKIFGLKRLKRYFVVSSRLFSEVSLSLCVMTIASVKFTRNNSLWLNNVLISSIYPWNSLSRFSLRKFH